MAAKTTPATPDILEVARAVIAERKLNPHQVAEASGLKYATVFRWINRERGLNADSLAAICQALGLKLVEGRGGLRP